MANNVVIVLHAGAATMSMALGAYNLARRSKGDRPHRWVGWVWVGAMYWTILSSFAIQQLRPGHFTWIHGLSVFTFGTLSIGVWAGLTHRVRTHRNFMTGSYFGLLGAFIGAVAVPQRKIPQWTLHQPAGLTLGLTVCLLTAAAVIVAANSTRKPPPSTPRPATAPGQHPSPANRPTAAPRDASPADPTKPTRTTAPTTTAGPTS